MFDLLKFKTRRNMQYLDRLLEVVLDPSLPFHNELWSYFAAPFGQAAQHAYQEAMEKLGELHHIVREYRRRG